MVWRVEFKCTEGGDDCPLVGVNKSVIDGAHVRDFCLNCEHFKVTFKQEK